ncbi:hypothetical protein MPTK1_7g06900 [Marchantia polymorpha subsp. ruderalis]|uniref:Uncharacterized protein n=2 Tax=Marchantia polymorpha TaxID=3197 RepID=A0AAF6BWX0_MARPO|nr:hypothetical protein MARPO_0199s0002 [Marchantia polymorpha]BBN16504.1 hypothetical protein Mp_7g06900 [Marchantia polymorpha subsp. ruderalis]|eukprot:PTQ27412.1 hypothetical protein MARPO_0199s0002 [Marchantia polymorpha]
MSLDWPDQTSIVRSHVNNIAQRRAFLLSSRARAFSRLITPGSLRVPRSAQVRILRCDSVDNNERAHALINQQT